MLLDDITPVSADRLQQAIDRLNEYNTKHESATAFDDLGTEKAEVLTQLLQWLDMPFSSAKLRHLALQTIKLLTREKQSLDLLGKDSAMATMMDLADLKLLYDPENIQSEQKGQEIVLEAQKCLCNILFQVEGARQVASTNGCVEAIVQRMKTYKDPDMGLMVKYYDMRMLFVLTALVPSTRHRLATDLHGITYLVEVNSYSGLKQELGRIPFSSFYILMVIAILIPVLTTFR